MILLAFDTAQGALSAALFDAGSHVANGAGQESEPVLLSHVFEARARGHAERLLPALEEVLAEAGLGFADLDALAVTVGPGTFTGLRVGLAAARGLALARKLPCIGVTTLEAVAEPVALQHGDRVAVSFDARREEVYFQIFDENQGVVTEPALLPLEIAAENAAQHTGAAKLVLAGTGAALLAERLLPMGVEALPADTRPQPDARAIGRIAIRRIGERGLDAFRVPPAPLYIRAPDAKLPGGLTLEEARERDRARDGAHD